MKGKKLTVRRDRATGEWTEGDTRALRRLMFFQNMFWLRGALNQVEAAARAGVPTLAVLTGGFSDQELRQAGAVATFESLTDLCERLDQTPLA